MTKTSQFVGGLDAFRMQLTAQAAHEGKEVLRHEHTLHFCLALGFQSALQLPPGSIVFERTIGRARIDLWLRPLDLIIEVKFMRPLPSGRNRPMTQQAGDLLADFNKVVHVPACDRLILLVADPVAVSHLTRNYDGILPMAVGTRFQLLPACLDQLATTAATRAVADGEWLALDSELIWQSSCEGWELFAWHVAPV